MQKNDYSDNWDTTFRQFIDAIDRDEYWQHDRAIQSSIEALQNVESSLDIEVRMRSILTAIVQKTELHPDLFAAFCSRLDSLVKQQPYQNLVLDWLNTLLLQTDRQTPTTEAILAAQLFLDQNDRPWQTIGETLIEWLDAADLNLRSCAAYKLGKFCHSLYCNWDWQDDDAEDILNYTYLEDGTWKWAFDPGVYEKYEQLIRGFPAPEDIRNLIRIKEIDRPGIAGAWLQGGGAIDLDLREWILDLLENSPTPEPSLPYYPIDLAMYAHEWYAKDADAIRRLIDMGRTDIAIAAATDEDCKIEELEPLLIELGNCDDPFIVRQASWHLAYYYHILHPNGEKLGYVEQIFEVPEIDLFLLFSDREKSESPYAAVLYAQQKDDLLKHPIAQKWIDRIFPKSVRGSKTGHHGDATSTWYHRGYIDRRWRDRSPNSDYLDRVIIGYRSNIPWNPKQFLSNN